MNSSRFRVAVRTAILVVATTVFSLIGSSPVPAHGDEDPARGREPVFSGR